MLPSYEDYNDHCMLCMVIILQLKTQNCQKMLQNCHFKNSLWGFTTDGRMHVHVLLKITGVCTAGSLTVASAAACTLTFVLWHMHIL